MLLPLVASQIVGILVILAWTVVTVGSIFLCLKLCNQLRVSSDVEFLGLDVAYHGGSAYNIDTAEEIKSRKKQVQKAHED